MFSLMQINTVYTHNRKIDIHKTDDSFPILLAKVPMRLVPIELSHNDV